jgi:ERCC4-related helicase
LFLVNIRNLIRQQKDALRKLFPDRDQYVVDGISDTAPFPFLIDSEQVQIIVVTAQILLNWLTDYEDEHFLDQFQLLILDECHHTTYDHPYNKIMRCYFREKADHHTMPQVR